MEKMAPVVTGVSAMWLGPALSLRERYLCRLVDTDWLGFIAASVLLPRIGWCEAGELAL